MSDMHTYQCRYAKAFWFFERVSDERFRIAHVLNAYLAKSFRSLDQHTFIDIGAGYGNLGRLIDGTFRRRIAIEPNVFATRWLSTTYDFTVLEPFNVSVYAAERPCIILMSQSLYFYRRIERLELLANLVSRLDAESLVCIVLDTFSGAFGKFLLTWLHEFGIDEQVILPNEIFSALVSHPGIELTFRTISSQLAGSNFLTFSRAIATYFDAVDPAWHATNREYRRDLDAFRIDDCFQAENVLAMWIIRRSSQ